MKNDDKREMTIDELEEQISEMKAKYDDLSKKLKQKKQDEADRKKAQLALEIVETSKHLNQLITDYTEDYGSFSFTRSSSEDDTFRAPWFWHYFF